MPQNRVKIAKLKTKTKTKTKTKPKPKPQPELAVYSQPKEQVGQLVTDDLQKALTECKERVEKIAKDCRLKNRKYR